MVRGPAGVNEEAVSCELLLCWRSWSCLSATISCKLPEARPQLKANHLSPEGRNTQMLMSSSWLPGCDVYHALEKLRHRCWEVAWSGPYLELQSQPGAGVTVPSPCSQLMVSLACSGVSSFFSKHLAGLRGGGRCCSEQGTCKHSAGDSASLYCLCALPEHQHCLWPHPLLGKAAVSGGQMAALHA